MASPVVTNSSSDLNTKTLLVAETSASITGGLIPASDAVQVGWLLRQQTTLTNANILALPTTGIQVIAAPGGGFRILLHCALLRITSSAGAYTNIDAGGFAGLIYSAGDQLSNYIANDGGASPVLSDFTHLLNGAIGTTPLTNFTQTTTPASSQWGNAALVSASNYAGQSVKLKFTNGSSGNLTGGNAANTGLVVCYYTIDPI